MKKKIQQGFSLLEVVIAITIFSVFVSVFLTGQGQNIADSEIMIQEVKLKSLCQKKLADIMQNPPSFTGIIPPAEEKDYEDEPDFRYKIQYKEFILPNFSAFSGQEDDQANTDANNQTIQEKIFNQIRDNIKSAIRQVEVTVIHKKTGLTYILTTWIRNKNARFKVNT